VRPVAAAAGEGRPRARLARAVECRREGVKSLSIVTRVSATPDENPEPIGNNGWMTIRGRSRFRIASAGKSAEVRDACFSTAGADDGAVTGAYMVIGLKHGAVSGQDQESKLRTYQLVREFTDRFTARHGSAVCRDLLGCDISTPEGMAEMKQKGLHGTVCVKAVRDACEILVEMLGR
jgi:C_GCAxxG_C_C family probable redox protein